MSYLTVNEYKSRSLIPSSIIDAVETSAPGFVQMQLEQVSAVIAARLAKRYAIFQPPYATILGDWVTAMTDLRVWLKRGVSSLDETWQLYKERHDAAAKDILEAANSETGMFEIPLTSDAAAATAVKYGTPFVYSEQSPYVASDRQAQVGHNEDTNHTGTGS